MPTDTLLPRADGADLLPQDRQTLKHMAENLIWLPAKGYGYYPVTAGIEPYDDGYFEEYVRRADTQVGRGITDFRVGLVDKFTSGEVLDVGIGCGAFIEARNQKIEFYRRRTLGYDVNPRGIDWLHKRGLWKDWREAESIPSVTLWDVLEHLPAPHELLDKVEKFVFVSLPIFEGPKDVLKSRHYKPAEHVWFFTRNGFYGWAWEYGFEVLDETWMESCKFKRDSVATFVLKRI